MPSYRATDPEGVGKTLLNLRVPEAVAVELYDEIAHVLGVLEITELHNTQN